MEIVLADGHGLSCPIDVLQGQAGYVTPASQSPIASCHLSFVVEPTSEEPLLIPHSLLQGTMLISVPFCGG